MSIIGLDVGDRRIGLAIAEEESSLAVPIGAVHRTSLERDLPRVADILSERRATLVVAGLPISIDGTLGPQARKTQRFLERLRRYTQLPIEVVDERYSSSEARRLMQGTGAQPSRRRHDIDASAATIILQSYLDEQKPQTQRTPSTP